MEKKISKKKTIQLAITISTLNSDDLVKTADLIKSDWEKIIQHDGNIDLIVFKAKRGTGDPGRIPLKMDKKFMTVTDREQDSGNKKPSKFD